MIQKSLKDISWQVSEEEYRKDPALSYSTLAKYEREGGFNSLPTLFDKVSTPSLTFGSVVDVLLLGTPEEFRERFLVAELPGLSDTLQGIADVLFEKHCVTAMHDTPFKDIPDESIALVGEKLGYYASPKYKNYRIKQIRENCEEYYNLRLILKDKELISSQDYADAQACCNAIKSAPGISDFFVENPFNEDVELLFQLKFKGNHDGVPYRSMMDICRVDHKNKIIYPADLKTSSHNEWEFYKSFVQWLYSIQAQLYVRNIKQTITKDDYFKDFKVADYTFIVVNRKTLKPLKWTFPFTHSECGWSYETPSGFKAKFRDPYVIGKELWTYLQFPANLPVDVKPDGDNDIVAFLQKK